MQDDIEKTAKLVAVVALAVGIPAVVILAASVIEGLLSGGVPLPILIWGIYAASSIGIALIAITVRHGRSS